MKPNELMLRDWVLKDLKFLEDDPMYTETDYQPYQIIRGEDIDIACETNWLGDDVYQPISLTAETLVKNGWEKIGRITYMDEQKCVLANYYDKWQMSYGDIDDYTNIPNIRYVHELQHALRLCGIDKEIEL